jgi:hypothetical protein
VRRWLGAFTALALVAGLIPGASVGAAEPTNMVLVWQQYAVEALSSPLPVGAGYTPPVAGVHLPIVQGAVYDAVNAIDGGYEPYLDNVPVAPATASKAAAAATAAHHVLVGLVPALPLVVQERLDNLYSGPEGSLSQIPDGQAKTDGIAIGAAVATLMLANRANDNRFDPYPFDEGSDPGEWRPTPPGFVNDPAAWIAIVTPFTLKGPSQFRTEGPPALNTPEYAADFNEVKTLGVASGSTRTPEQTLLAQYFSSNPFPYVNRAIREIAAAKGLSPEDQARFFATTSMSAADSFISCWDDKHFYDFWRPITAIADAANDGNPDTSPPPPGVTWTPFFANPPYPEHPSGFNCFTGSMTRSVREFFHTDKIAIQLNNPAFATPREYDRLSDVVRDTIDARIWMGIHFRTADVQAAWLGKKVAQWVHKRFFQPVD